MQIPINLAANLWKASLIYIKNGISFRIEISYGLQCHQRISNKDHEAVLLLSHSKLLVFSVMPFKIGQCKYQNRSIDKVQNLGN